ncbi:MAG: glutamate racemase, partial [Flavobacteriaceae bacterium]
MQNNPIGIFDSGVGGTSIWREMIKLLPEENTIYLADSKNAPYGEKTPTDILNLSIKNTELLLARGCKLIVVACNTATTNAISHLRAQYDLPFIGIEPAIKPAALKSKTKTVGVLATKGTLSSELFSKTSKDHAANITIVEREGIGLVSLLESGELHSRKTSELLQEYLSPMLAANMDHLVLGCTHYPYLMPILKQLLPEDVKIIDCGEAVAKQTERVLNQHKLRNVSGKEGMHQLYTNGE